MRKRLNEFSIVEIKKIIRLHNLHAVVKLQQAKGALIDGIMKHYSGDGSVLKSSHLHEIKLDDFKPTKNVMTVRKYKKDEADKKEAEVKKKQPEIKTVLLIDKPKSKSKDTEDEDFGYEDVPLKYEKSGQAGYERRIKEYIKIQDKYFEASKPLGILNKKYIAMQKKKGIKIDKDDGLNMEYIRNELKDSPILKNWELALKELNDSKAKLNSWNKRMSLPTDEIVDQIKELYKELARKDISAERRDRVEFEIGRIESMNSRLRK